MDSIETHQLDRDALGKACTRHFPESLAFLKRLVDVNSFTLNRSGVAEVGRLTAEMFAELGFVAACVPSTNPDFGDHLLLTRRGEGTRGVAWISHLDTVFTEEEEAANNFAWRDEGERIYGPGTLDIKGGTALVLQTLRALQEVAPDTFEKTDWHFLLNSSEEMPSPDFGDLCRKHIPAGTRAALVVEGGAWAGNSHAFVTARKGRAVFRAKTIGRAAHSGNLHHRGVNAITQLAHTVQRLDALTNHEAGLTVNVGVISGGTTVNRVPHQAEAEIEMRAFDAKVYQDGLDAIRALASDVVVQSAEDGMRCGVQIDLSSEVPPWPPNPATNGLYERWQAAGRELGLTILRQERGGLSDANRMWDHVPTLDGVGPCGDNAHCSERRPDGSKDQEYVERDSFLPRAMLNCVALQALLHG